MTNFVLDPGLIVQLLSDDNKTLQSLLIKSQQHRDGLWIYIGSVDEIIQKLSAVLKSVENNPLSVAKERVADMGSRCNWLAALAEDGDLIEHEDLSSARTQRARQRLGQQAMILTLNTAQSINNSDVLDIDSYLEADSNSKGVAFIDLEYQQRLVRPEVERGLFKVLHHGRYIAGPEIELLEERLADYCDVKHAIAVSNGTDALLIALMAAGVGTGDEVITSPFTFAATGEMILLLGAIPVYIDIDPVSYNLDPACLENAITAKTKAIIPVSIFGQCADMDDINLIASNAGISVIEDAAQSFGASYKGRKSGNLCDMACTSFFPSKPLGGYGDSGACFTNNDGLADAIRQIRDHGQTGRYQHTRLGLNGRMSSFQASVLLAKLELFKNEAKLRAEIGDRYTSMLIERGAGKELPITPPMLKEGNISVYAQYSILVKNRDTVQQTLTQMGIPSAVHYPIPLNHQPAMKTEQCDVPISERVSKEVMSLPMHPYISLAEQQRVIDSLISAVEKLR